MAKKQLKHTRGKFVMTNTPSNVGIQLSKTKKNLVQLGCICLMLSIAMFGLALATLQAPILTRMNAMS